MIPNDLDVIVRKFIFSLISYRLCGEKILINSFLERVRTKVWKWDIIEGNFLDISSFHIHGGPYHEFNDWTTLWIWENETPISVFREYLRITSNRNINFVVNWHKRREKSLQIKRRENYASQDLLGRLNKKIQPKEKKKSFRMPLNERWSNG